MLDTGAHERQLTAAAALDGLDAGHPPELTGHATATLTHLLENPLALNTAGTEKQLAAGLVWRLGIANQMSHLVLRSVANLQIADPEILINFEHGPAIARDMLRANPFLLKNADQETARIFWDLAGYNPKTHNENNPFSIFATLEVLQEAAFIPDEVVAQMRHYRDSSSTMHHEPHFKGLAIAGESYHYETQELSDREKELNEATVRTILGAFVAQYTGNSNDRRIATAALEDFTGRALTGPDGFTHALLVMLAFKETGIGRDEHTQRLTSLLQSRVSEYSLRLDLSDTHLDLLTMMAELVYLSTQKTPNAELQELLPPILQKLKEHETLYNIGGGDPHLADGQATNTLTMQQVSQAHTAKEDLSRILHLLQNGSSDPTPAPETIAQQLATQGFSMQLVQEAFRLVGTELDAAKKTQLVTDFDAAITTALRNLAPDHAYLQSGGLAELTGASNFGMLARFASGRQFIAERTLAFSELANRHLQKPDLWLNKQNDCSFIAAQWIDHFYTALRYNQDYFAEASTEGYKLIKSLLETTQNIMDFIDMDNAHSATLQIAAETAPKLLDMLTVARTAFHRNMFGHKAVAQAAGSPLDQILTHYERL